MCIVAVTLHLQRVGGAVCVILRFPSLGTVAFTDALYGPDTKSGTVNKSTRLYTDVLTAVLRYG